MISCASNILFARYEAITIRQQVDHYADHPRLSLVNLAWMCREARLSQGPFPLDKADRWLGFEQGCLAMRGLIDVDEEREISRPLFTRAARAASVDPGPTRARLELKSSSGMTA